MSVSDSSVVKLQRELNKSGVPRCLELSELRRAKFNGDRLYLTSSPDRSPKRIHMVEDIEEVCPELKPHLLMNGKGLKEGHIPGLQAGAANYVSAFVSKCTLNQVAGKSTSIEERPRHTRCGVRIPDYIGPGAVKPDGAAAVRIGTVHKRIGHGKPVAGRS